MRRIDVFGLSRTRDSKGAIVKRSLRDHVNCIHTFVGGGYETMQILVVEVYEEDTAEHDRGRDKPDDPRELPQGGNV